MHDFKELLDNFEAFRRETYEGNGALMPKLVEQGQDPDYFIISCIDSRSNPGTIFRAPPGTFFAHKAMGAIVRPYQKGRALSAALQFAIKYNNVSKIIVLGHTQCGAIQALVESIDDEEISSFIDVAKGGFEKAKACCADETQHDDLFRHTEEQIILQSTENLKTYPAVKEALAAGKLKIMSWLFNMEEGAIYNHDETIDDFVKISPQDSPV
ncbi:MAG: hypothetical protein H6867_09080 [Rhodospirillales bacterium]|nr:hypothetical protein [Rhodospirillales bacterium]MCB9996041.1 hypothetical protein [Rhodospirillales bacterium]